MVLLLALQAADDEAVRGPGRGGPQEGRAGKDPEHGPEEEGGEQEAVRWATKEGLVIN